jgi:hypothetical protein
VSDAFVDPPDGEGIGAAYVRLAEALAAAGHHVTLLEASDGPADGAAAARRMAEYRRRGVRLVRLPESPMRLASISPGTAVSYRVYCWLRDCGGGLDVVHLPARRGLGYYALLGRRQGLILPRAAAVAGLGAAAGWEREASDRLAAGEAELEEEYIERRAAELADAVWGDGPVLDWARSRGWDLPGPVGRAEADVGEWVRRHEALAAARSPAAGAGAWPTISACVAHHGRPGYLRQALRSLAGQAVPPLEVVVVDDGSPGEGVQRELDRIEREFDFAGRGWRLVRQGNRNGAAAEARGEYLLFMDDDNVARAAEVATFAAVAGRTGADLITCTVDVFRGNGRPRDKDRPSSRRLFVGANPPLSVLDNTFGDGVALVRRSAFHEVGGFAEHQGGASDDWELFTRIMLAGYSVEVIPEPLCWRREPPEDSRRPTRLRADYVRALRPHLAAIPQPYHSLIETVLARSLRERPRDPGQGEIPLRYRVVDALDDWLKRARPVHRLARRLIVAALRLRSVVLGRGTSESAAHPAADGPAHDCVGSERTSEKKSPASHRLRS